MKAVGIEPPLRRWTEPEVVIDSGGRIAIGRIPETVSARIRRPLDCVIQQSGFALVPCVQAVNQADLSQRSLANELRSVGKKRAAPLLQAHFNDPATSSGLRDQNGAL